jgi:hypothetical protein
VRELYLQAYQQQPHLIENVLEKGFILNETPYSRKASQIWSYQTSSSRSNASFFQEIVLCFQNLGNN